MSDSRTDRIQRRAHEIWQREGSPSGRESDHWRQAEQEIEAEERAASSRPYQPGDPDRRQGERRKSDRRRSPSETQVGSPTEPQVRDIPSSGSGDVSA